MIVEALKETVAWLASGEDVVLVTVVEAKGSVPARVGFKMAVSAKETTGTVGGGALENAAIGRARDLLLQGGGARLERIDVAALDMTCGGEVALFFEPLVPATALWIFGGGHIGAALAPMASAIGFSVTVADNRPEFADQARFPAAVRTICTPYDEAAAKVPKEAFVVIVTHGHVHDEGLLDAMIRKEPRLPYIGMIGSSRKVEATFAGLRARGVEPGPNVYAPVGLDLGGDTPGEIALAIAAQILGVRHGKSALPHYRDRRAPNGGNRNP